MNVVALALIVLWLLAVASGYAPGAIVYVLPALAVVLFFAGLVRASRR